MLVPFVEYSVQNAPKVYLKPSHWSFCEKKLTALLKSQVSFDRGVNMLSSVKVCENATKQILHKFVTLIFFKIVVLKATPDSKPIPNFNHLQQRSFHRRSCSQMFFKIGVSKRFVNLTGKHQCWSCF